MPSELVAPKEAFARSGIAHLLSISGFHVAVVAGLLVAVLRAARVPRNAALLGGIVGVWGYVLLIGAPDAGVRAAILFSLLILARWVGGVPGARITARNDVSSTRTARSAALAVLPYLMLPC